MTQQVQSKRIDYIDLAKGFCILFVVCWHCMQFCHTGDIPLNRAMMTFRMPLYFVLSGLFFKEYGGFKDFLRRKTNKLIVPFAAFYILTCILLPVILDVAGSEFTLRHFCGYFIGWIREGFHNLAMWFLLCLFDCYIIFYAIVLLSKRTARPVAAIIILSCCAGCAGCLLGYNGVNVRMYIDSALTCTPYFCFGYLLRKYTGILYPNKYDSLNWLWCLLCGVCVYLLTLNTGKVDYRINNVGGGGKFYDLLRRRYYRDDVCPLLIQDVA